MQSATARARKMADMQKAGKGSQLKTNAASMNTICNICKQQFMCTVNISMLKQHAESRHAKQAFSDCFPDKE